MGHQLRRLHGSSGDQIEKGLHVALLGPAHIAERVIDAILFIRTVVTTWAVRPRETDLQLLLVVGVARHVHADHADGDYHGPVAGEARRELNRVARARGGGDEDRIGAATLAEGLDAV